MGFSENGICLICKLGFGIRDSGLLLGVGSTQGMRDAE